MNEFLHWLPCAMSVVSLIIVWIGGRRSGQRLAEVRKTLAMAEAINRDSWKKLQERRELLQQQRALLGIDQDGETPRFDA